MVSSVACQRMRTLLLFAGFCLCLSFASTASAAGKDTRDPKITITKVIQKKVKGGHTFFNFFVTATDKAGIRRIEYRVAVDGKSSGWTHFPYYEGTDNQLPFTVDCNVFRFEVRAIDNSRNKSKVAKKSYSGLQ